MTRTTKSCQDDHVIVDCIRDGHLFLQHPNGLKCHECEYRMPYVYLAEQRYLAVAIAKHMAKELGTAGRNYRADLYRRIKEEKKAWALGYRRATC